MIVIYQGSSHIVISRKFEKLKIRKKKNFFFKNVRVNQIYIADIGGFLIVNFFKKKNKMEEYVACLYVDMVQDSSNFIPEKFVQNCVVQNHVCVVNLGTTFYL